MSKLQERKDRADKMALSLKMDIAVVDNACLKLKCGGVIVSVIERLKKGTSKLIITKLSYNAPGYVRAREQEIELMGIIEQQSKQIESAKEILGYVLSDFYLSDGMRSEIERIMEWDGGSGE